MPGAPQGRWEVRMTILGSMTVLPRLPEAIEALEGLARNLAWTWDQDCRALFRELDVELWERVNHNPLALLREVAQERLDAVAGDGAYVARLTAAVARIADDARTPRWFQREVGTDHLSAYFCAE
jgi:starch phosphorylase